MSAHTPGTWVAECVGTSSLGPDGKDVYEVNNGHVRVAEHLWEADANLIAAAPTMLDVLTEARLQIEYLHEKFQPTSSGVAVLSRIEAAIAKATRP